MGKKIGPVQLLNPTLSNERMSVNLFADLEKLVGVQFHRSLWEWY